MPDAIDAVRAHVWVKGRVQAVGFRAYVKSIALQTGVTGWVRNIGYSEVEAVAEGERATVEKFIELMKQGPRASRVDESKIEWEASTGEFREFGVKRSL
ncbi:MAG: acylphosphatase [Anaerolineales bacterium]|nr:acylphosphatase [Anaerolineales bacterium]